MIVHLYNGDAAEVMRREIATGSVDLVYSDPPFGNRQVWTGKAGSFSDQWVWDSAAARRWKRLVAFSPEGAALITAITPDPRDRSYLAMVAELMIEIRRVLKPTGSLWLHFDDTMGAHLRILGDVVFGVEHQLGQVFWRRTSSHNTSRAFGRVHDTIAVFARSRAARWRLARARSDLIHGDPCRGLCVDGLLQDRLNARSRERVDYPTQKPVALLDRIVLAGTLAGDVVLDPTCGSGTTLVAARRNGRKAIGIDLSDAALACAARRLALPQTLDVAA